MRKRLTRDAAVLAVASLALAGFAAGCGSDDDGDGSAATNGAAAAHSHAETVAAPAGMTVSLRVLKDSKKGYNAVIMPTGFRFAPAAAGGEHVPGEGHAHLMVDGTQIARPYAARHWFDLPPGMHEVRVTLNANTHAGYARDRQPVAASVMVDVPESDGADHEHDGTEGSDHHGGGSAE
ncbi:MAG: hypothetical protein ACR2N6_08040 [Miltoncostaeaceae bacterium]